MAASNRAVIDDPDQMARRAAIFPPLRSATPLPEGTIHLPVISQPCVFTDQRGYIMAWSLPGIVQQSRQVSSFTHYNRFRLLSSSQGHYPASNPPPGAPPDADKASSGWEHRQTRYCGMAHFNETIHSRQGLEIGGCPIVPQRLPTGSYGMSFYTPQRTTC